MLPYQQMDFKDAYISGASRQLLRIDNLTSQNYLLKNWLHSHFMEDAWFCLMY